LRERRINRKFERRIDPSLKFDPAEVGRTTCTDLDIRTNGSVRLLTVFTELSRLLTKRSKGLIEINDEVNWKFNVGGRDIQFRARDPFAGRTVTSV